MTRDNQAILELMALSGHENPHERLRAIRLLTKQDDPRILPTLLAALNDPEPSLRTAAAAALGRLRAGQAKWQLLERLGDENISVCHAVVEALGEIADPDAVPGLALTLKNAKEPDLKLAAVHALNKIGGSSALLALQAAAQDSTDDVQKAALHAIESLTGQKSQNATVPERRIGEFPFRWGLVVLLLAATALPLTFYYGLQWATRATPAPQLSISIPSPTPNTPTATVTNSATPSTPTATLPLPTETPSAIPVDYSPVDVAPLPSFISDRFIVFDSGQGTGAYDNMTYCEYESQITLTLENDVSIRAVRPIINSCNGDCGYTLSVRNQSMQLLGSQSGEVHGDEVTTVQLFNLDKVVEMRKGTPYIISIRVWSDYAVGILTTGNRTTGVKGLGQYTVNYASSVCSNLPVVDHLARGSISFQLFE